MPTEFAVYDELAQLCQSCRQERQVFFHQKQPLSPACVSLFRTAFQANHQQAWSCIKEIFEPLLYSWVSKQARFEVEDVVQETWLDFYKGTTHNFRILDENHLAPILSYLKTCALNTLAQMARKPTQHLRIESLDDIVDQLNDPMDEMTQAQLRIDFERALADFFQQVQFTEVEHILFRLKFMQQLKPREILAEWPQLAEDYDALEVALQRISRRMRQHEGFRNLVSPRRKSADTALLKIVTEQIIETEEINVDQPCGYDEAVLLDYIMGLVEAEVGAAIQASPACLRQASQLAQTFGPFLRLVYRLDCPNPTALVAYQQRVLPGSQRLVIYRHLEQCLRCQEDLMLLNSVDQPGTVRETNLLRRMVEALYQSPVAFGLQGGWLHFRTPEVFINISSRQNRSKARSWRVRAQVRTHEGAILTATVQAAALEALDQSTPVTYQPDTPTDENSLVFREVQAGNYSLLIVMPNEDIVIRNLAIGDDE